MLPAAASASPTPVGARQGSRADVGRALLSGLLLAAGVALVLLAGWDLVGSNLYAQARQQDLSARLSDSGPAGDPLALVVSEGGDVLDPALEPTWGRVTEPPEGLALGDPLATLTFPTLGLEHTMVVGATLDELTAGPGWMVGSSLPGTPGNAVVAGHRTTYGAPFHDLHLLEAGDRVVVSRRGRPDDVFEVRDVFVVDPDEGEVTAPTDGVRLTLFACHPIGSAAERIVVQAELVDGLAEAEALPAGRWRPYGGGARSLL